MTEAGASMLLARALESQGYGSLRALFSIEHSYISPFVIIQNKLFNFPRTLYPCTLTRSQNIDVLR